MRREYKVGDLVYCNHGAAFRVFNVMQNPFFSYEAIKFPLMVEVGLSGTEPCDEKVPYDVEF